MYLIVTVTMVYFFPSFLKLLEQAISHQLSEINSQRVFVLTAISRCLKHLLEVSHSILCEIHFSR